MKNVLFIIFLLIICFTRLSTAQELNCTIQVESQQIGDVDKNVFDAMQKSIYEFMNTRKWTNEVFSNEERIECSIFINLTERISNDEYKGTIQIQARRPIFNSSYSSTLFNHLDNDFQAKYLQYESLEFSENNHLSNLTSILAFYAYMIIGLDYDSYALEGGTPYFQKALAVVNSAQNTADEGWKAFEGSNNRYWMADNILNQTFKPLRECMYKYHRLGFDILSEKTDEGRATITSSLDLLEQVHRDKPSSFNMQLFFNAKSDELINLYSQAPPPDKAKMVNLLSRIDPANANKYQKILAR